jgi:hypothetical protein
MSKDFMKTLQDATNAVQAKADAARLKHTAAAVKAVGGSAATTKTASVNSGHPSNAYPHHADSVSAASATPKADFQSNLLDAYDVVTYHWKLFIVSTKNSGTSAVLNPKSQTVIAETGVTDLTIDKVEIRTVAIPTTEIGTGTSTAIKFEIVEPGGASLLDNLFYEAVALGLGNWGVMPFYLQLEFRGRDPATSNSDADGTPGALANLKWLIPMKVTTIKANVTEVGTRYNFQGLYYNEIAQTNAYFNMPHNIVLSKLDRFGDTMAELADVINLDQFIKTIDNVSIPDVYKIVVDPEIANTVITPVTNNADPSRSNSYVTFNGKTAQFNANTSVDKIIDTLLSHTSKYQKALVKSKTPGAEGSISSEDPDHMRSLWRIVTETRPIGFDVRRGVYAVEITIFVIDYDISVLSANQFQAAANKESSIQRYATYVNKSILRKKYNYIFTGLNDQVMAFDLTFNNAHATAMARFGGIYLNSSMASKGVVTNTSAADERAITEQLQNYIKLQHNPSTLDSKEALAAESTLKTSMKSATLQPDVRERFKRILSSARPADARNYLNNAVKSGGVNLDGSFATAKADAKSLATPLGENLPSFISDININEPKTAQAYVDFIDLNRAKMRPRAFTEQTHGTSVGPGIESSSNTGVNKLASLFSVALHSGSDANLVSMKLTIKGDPFWIAPGPIRKDRDGLFISTKPIEEAMRLLKDVNKEYVNIRGTDNFIVISFRSPRIVDASSTDDASTPYTNSEMFSGVYKVTQIVHRFDMGKFVQELDCILDDAILYADIAHLIKDDAISPAPAITVKTFSKFKIPAAAQPTNRIMGAVSDLTNGISSATATASNTAGNLKTTLASNIPSSLADSIRGQTKIT